VLALDRHCLTTLRQAAAFGEAVGAACRIDGVRVTKDTSRDAQLRFSLSDHYPDVERSTAQIANRETDNRADVPSPTS
jgi:hypothetical protein